MTDMRDFMPNERASHYMTIPCDLESERHTIDIVEDYRSLLLQIATPLLSNLADCNDLEEARENLYNYVSEHQRNAFDRSQSFTNRFRIRNAVRVFLNLLDPHNEKEAKFSFVRALWDISNQINRSDLKPDFLAETYYLFLGLHGQGDRNTVRNFHNIELLKGRQAAIRRSKQLDELATHAESTMNRYPDGLSKETIRVREKYKQRILNYFSATEEDWNNWIWQTRHVIKDTERLQVLVQLTDNEKHAIRQAKELRLPFGATPFYLSLLNDFGNDDRSLRAQIFPPQNYIAAMRENRDDLEYAFDFMGEHDTSPKNLITRRYANILILKPYNSCPQICVYCQRNWEIDEAMAPEAMATPDQLTEAIEWIAQHDTIHEVLITGGDPLVMGDGRIRDILTRLSEISHVSRVRIGSRMPVTVPMRITDELVNVLKEFTIPGVRSLDLVTHVQHPYEINPDMVTAVQKLRDAGIGVYNQMVFTFYISRRFEAAKLRRMLKQIGIDPYYTFNPKGKGETANYRVPLARLLQERGEEARLLPGLERTDEPVYNVPKLGKNYLNSAQDRDLIAILPTGERLYEFHPWEKNIAEQQTYIGKDVPILSYLKRLEQIGEDIDDYSSIFYYY